MVTGLLSAPPPNTVPFQLYRSLRQNPIDFAAVLIRNTAHAYFRVDFYPETYACVQNSDSLTGLRFTDLPLSDDTRRQTVRRIDIDNHGLRTWLADRYHQAPMNSADFERSSRTVG